MHWEIQQNLNESDPIINRTLKQIDFPKQFKEAILYFSKPEPKRTDPELRSVTAFF